MTQTMEARGYLGSGHIAAAIKMSPYQTALAAYMEIIGTAPEHDADKLRFFRNRRRAEPYIFATLEEEYGIKIVAANRRYTDATYDFMRAELDAEILPYQGADRIEAKSADPRAAKRWGKLEHDESIPDDVLCQVMFAFGVKPSPGALVVAQVGWDDTRLLPVEPNAEVIKMVRAKGCEFWFNHVVPGIPPAPVSVADALLLFPSSIAKPILSTPEVEAALREMAQIDLDEEKLKARKETCSTLVRAYMKDNDTLLKEGIGTLATYKSNRQTIKLDADALVAAYEAKLSQTIMDAAAWIQAERKKVSTMPVPIRPLRNLTKKK